MSPSLASSARPTKKARRSSSAASAPKNLRDTLLQGKKVVAKSKTDKFKDTRQASVNESGATLKAAVSSRTADIPEPAPAVAGAENAASSESGEDDSSEDDDDVEMGDVDESSSKPKGAATAQGSQDSELQESGSIAAVEPSFSDLISTQSGIIHVDDNETGGSSTALALSSTNDAAGTKGLALSGPESNPSSLSAPHLTSLLTTALQTRDLALLKTCLSPRNTPASLATIRLTIERLPSALVVDLLGHIADVMHRRPGRAGSLMVWVQWSLVCHGGYIATLCATPDDRSHRGKGAKGPTRNQGIMLLQKLRALDQVCNERKRNMERLLQLKGKLDLLVAQSKLRRERVESKRRQHDADSTKRVWIEEKDGDNEVAIGPAGVSVVEKVVDVEKVLRIEATPRSTKKKAAGRDSAVKGGVAFDTESSGDEDEDDGVVPVSFMSDSSKAKAKGKKGKRAVEEDEDMMDEDEDEDDDSMDDLGGLLDVEAEETDNEESDEEEEEDDSEEDDEDDDEDDLEDDGEDLEDEDDDDDDEDDEDGDDLEGLSSAEDEDGSSDEE